MLASIEDKFTIQLDVAIQNNIFRIIRRGKIDRTWSIGEVLEQPIMDLKGKLFLSLFIVDDEF